MKQALQSFLTSYLLGCKNKKISENSVVLHDRFSISVEHFSETGFHTFSDDIKDNGRPISFFEFVDELTKMEAVDEEARALFNQRVRASAQTTKNILDSKLVKLSPKNLSFKTTEQSLVFGHFSHPYPKLMEGPGTPENIYQPVQLQWCFVKKDLLYIERSKAFSEENLFEALETLAGEMATCDHVLFPFHPYQFHTLELKDYVDSGSILPLKTEEKEWIPTTSVRSLYNENENWMLKFSLNLRLTNSIRTLQMIEVRRGLQLHEVFQSPEKTLTILHEPAFMALKKRDGSLWQETIVILRENPFKTQTEKVISLATLNQSNPESGTPFIHELIKNTSPEKWFNSFLETTILPFISLQAVHGVYLGAHQQNIILKLDDDYYPIHTYYRDCQGTGFSKHAAQLSISRETILDSDFANRLMGYYLFINSTLFTIKSIAHGNREIEKNLIELFVTKVKNLDGVKDHSFIDYVLKSETFLIKDNYICCLKNINENTMSNPLDIYINFPNPFGTKMKHFSLTRINSGLTYQVEVENSALRVKTLSEECSFHFEVNNIKSSSSAFSDELSDVALEVLFYEHPTYDQLTLNHKTYSRESFFNQTGIWNSSTDSSRFDFPLRYPFKAGQKLYSRYVPAVDAHVSFRVITENDIDTFHEWHNQPRVANFWELALSKEELLSYIQKGLNDSHQIPVIAEINGESVGYFEMYWTKEDRLGPYYESGPYDRGFHLLIGNKNYLGFKNTDALLKSACHFLFLDDSRTNFIMGEPRHDNQKLLRYLLSFKAWRKVKEFDFPHKRAALLECDRTLFFQGQYL